MKYLLFITFILFCLAASGEPETRKVIVVLDTGIARDAYIDQFLCSGFHKDFTGEGIEDVNGHGTDMAYIISRHINQLTHCIAAVKYYHTTGITTAYLEGLKYISGLRVSYLNISSGGADPLDEEKAYLKLIVSKKVHVATAAGNWGEELTPKNCYYPACYSFGAYFHVVGGLDAEGKRMNSSNYGSLVNHWELGYRVRGKDVVTGTSAATAIYTGKLAGGVYK